MDNQGTKTFKDSLVWQSIILTLTILLLNMFTLLSYNNSPKWESYLVGLIASIFAYLFCWMVKK